MGSGRGSSALAEIDPPRCHRAAVDGGLLRARGDRPSVMNHGVCASAAPPRSRRSTRPPRGDAHADGGSSALAEIDPSSSTARATRGGLLRARGDRPVRPRPVRGARSAPPRSRRSTPSAVTSRRAERGSSALAEIDPWLVMAGRGFGRLLRARGDRPLATIALIVAALAPPRSRRSTHDLLPDERLLHGSSALAEIDPPCARASRRRPWLLRARGDRPSQNALSASFTMAPPRSRRSTRAPQRGSVADDGSSALAEIDHAVSGGSSMTWAAPPRSRRSTRLRGDAPWVRAGSSALAEIDPRPFPSSRARRGSVGARGDRTLKKI